MDSTVFTEEHLRDVNEVLHGPDFTPVGAYCMGLLSGAATKQKLAVPDRAALLRAVRCLTVAEGEAWAEEWVHQAMEARTR